MGGAARHAGLMSLRESTTHTMLSSISQLHAICVAATVTLRGGACRSSCGGVMTAAVTRCPAAARCLALSNSPAPDARAVEG